MHTQRIVNLTTLQPVKRGNWILRYSFTNYFSIMLLAKSTISDNVFVKFFQTEDEAASFTDFLVHHDFYHPYPMAE